MFTDEQIDIGRALRRSSLWIRNGNGFETRTLEGRVRVSKRDFRDPETRELCKSYVLSLTNGEGTRAMAFIEGEESSGGAEYCRIIFEAAEASDRLFNRFYTPDVIRLNDEIEY